MNATEKRTPTLQDMPPLPEGAPFRLVKIEKVSMPHPYCITPKHVEVAADHFGGMLGEAAIAEAEKRGAKCDICKQAVRRRKQDRILAYDEHETMLSLFVGVPHHDLNNIPGLVAYLNAVKSADLGIQGFAFRRWRAEP